MSLVMDAVLRLVCRLYGHRWSPFERMPGDLAKDRTMRYATRSYCACCESNRLVFDDGDELIVTRDEVVGLSPRWLEGLYRARWLEYPKVRVAAGGAFPDEWAWNEVQVR